MTDPGPRPPLSFDREQRLKRQEDIDAVLDRGIREVRHPLIGVALPGAMPRTRLGIRISRRVGNAVKRNRIKRLIREAFRLDQHAWIPPVDLILVVRTHVPASPETYAGCLADLRVSLLGRMAG